MTADHTGLRVRQGRNFITVREKPVIDQFHGTLVNPKPIELPEHGGVAEVSTELGYEAVPSTDVWLIRIPRLSHLRVDRLCDDRYAVHVGAALIDMNNKRVAPLVQSASGRGELVTVEPGTYKIVASLGMPVRLPAITFRLDVVQVSASIQALGLITLQGIAKLRQQHLVALGLIDLSGTGTMNSRSLKGDGVISLEFTGSSRLQQYRLYTKAIGVAQVVASGIVSAYNTAQMVVPGASLLIEGTGRLAAIVWVNDPTDRRRAWMDTNGQVVLNRPYVNLLDGDAYTIWARLEQILQELAGPARGNQIAGGGQIGIGASGQLLSRVLRGNGQSSSLSGYGSLNSRSLVGTGLAVVSGGSCMAQPRMLGTGSTLVSGSGSIAPPPAS